MSRRKIQASYLGSFTVAALDAAPEAEAAWLIHALCGWILRDELPKNIPPTYASVWAVIRAESEVIHAAKKQDAENGKRGGRPVKKPKPKETQSEETGTQKNPNETKMEKESKIENVSCSLSTREPANPDEEVTCPLSDDDIAVKAHNLDLLDDDIAAWKDYYGALGWKFKPDALRPMSRNEAMKALNNWKRRKQERAGQGTWKPQKTALTAYQGNSDDYANLPPL